jgi:L-threonylcarbamoyladenylate synthase
MNNMPIKETLLLDDSDESIAIAADIIRIGGLAAFPTETVYGLGANALLSEAAYKIYTVKGRPADNPLIIHLADAADAEKYAYTCDMYHKIAERFMPGPLTVILKKRDSIPASVTGGLDTVAIRVPSNETAHKLIEFAGVPIAAPSANVSGKPSPTEAAHVMLDLNGRIDAVIDGGKCDIGVESTIININGVTDSVTILRPGAVTYDDLIKICGNVELGGAVKDKFKGKPTAPGMKYRHYAPTAKLYLLDGCDEKFYRFINGKNNCGVLCCTEDLPCLDDKTNVLVVLGSRHDSSEQARNLFGCLRRFNETDVEQIYARLPNAENGMELAVYNRLIKAAGYEIIKL